MADLFWPSDEQWAVVGRFMPINQPGAWRLDDRRVVSGILHMLRTGGRWGDVPADYGPATTVYNRFNRWSRRGFWRAMLAALAEAGWIAQTAAIGSTYTKAHRCAHRGKRGETPGDRSLAGRADHESPRPVRHPRRSRHRPPHPGQRQRCENGARRTGGRSGPHTTRRLRADKGYDADWLRANLRRAAIVPVIPGTRSRKRPIRFDKRRYKDRWRAEAVFCRLKNFRGVATRYDKLARNYASAVALAAIAAFWC